MNRSTSLAGVLFLGSGASLLAYIIAGVSLLGALLFAIVVAGAAGALLWRRADVSGRTHLSQAIRAGALAGGLATAAYDLFRYLLVKGFGYAFWPFDIFMIFGRSLLGSEAGVWVPVTGVAFHILNGVGFAIAYTIWLGRRGVLAGIAWAMLLETLMVTVYPGWLGLKALNEFLQVSIFGHLIYGLVLGLVARRLLQKGEVARP